MVAWLHAAVGLSHAQHTKGTECGRLHLASAWAQSKVNKVLGTPHTPRRATLLVHGQVSNSPIPPSAVISGPTTLGSACSGSAGTTVTFDGSASPVSQGRPLTQYVWAATRTGGTISLGLSAAIVAANQATALGTQSRLSLSPTVVAALNADTYTITLTVTNWLAQSASTSITVTKAAAPVPVVSIIGGSTQSFMPSNGLRLSAQVDKSSVCAGSQVRRPSCCLSLVAARACSSNMCCCLVLRPAWDLVLCKAATCCCLCCMACH